MEVSQGPVITLRQPAGALHAHGQRGILRNNSINKSIMDVDLSRRSWVGVKPGVDAGLLGGRIGIESEASCALESWYH